MSFPSRPRTITALVGLGVVALISGGLISLFLLLGASGAGAAPSCTDTYSGAAGGSWNTASNWSSSAVPGATSFVCIPASEGTITYTSASTTIDALLSVGSGSTLSITSGSLVVQDTSVASSANAITVAGGTIYFDDATSITSLSISSGSLSGIGSITAGSLSWTGGDIGNGNSGSEIGSLTTSGTATVDLSTASGTSDLEDFTATFDGPTSIEAPLTDPGFQLSYGTFIFADTTSPPTIAEGVDISNYYPGRVEVEHGVTLEVTGSSGATTTIEPAFSNYGTVDVPSGGTLALTGGGTSSGTFSLTGNGILDAYDVTFDSTGTAVTGSSGTFGVNDSSIDSNVSVGTLTEYGSSTTYFYGTVTATTITTGANTGASPQANLDFLGPTVTASTLDVYGGSVSGTASISAVTFNWDGGSIGNDNGGNEIGNLTTSGTATVDLSTASGTSDLDYFTATFDGPTSIEAPITDPGFQLSYGTFIFADTTSPPTIAEGVDISNYYPGRVEVEHGVTLEVTGSSGATTTIEPAFSNYGTVDVPSGATLALTGGGTSSGTFALAGNGILDAYDVTFDSTGTAVTGSSGTFGVNDSSIDSNISVGTLTEYGTSTTYFYGTVTATTITTGANTGASPQANFDFLGQTVTASTLDVYGGSVSGTASISAVTFNWDGGSIGNDNGGNEIGSLTTSGTATVDLSTAEGTSALDYFTATFDGPTSIEAPITDPGFQLSYGTFIFADTTSPPTIAEGVDISNYYPGRVEVEHGVTLEVTGSSGATTTIEPAFSNYGTVDVPSGATLALTGGGTSSGTFSLTGNGILDAYDVTFDSTGTAVTGSSGTFGVNDSSIDSNVSVGTLTEYGSSTTYFYGTVTATTITTGANTGASPQENFVFLGPTVTTSTLDVYGGSVSGTALISAVTFNWDGGSIGNYNSDGEIGSLTTSGTATVDLSTAEGTSSVDDASISFDGPTSIEAPITDPGLDLSAGSIIFADTTSPPTIAEGVDITMYYGSRVEVESGVTLEVTGSSGATTTIATAFSNYGTVDVPSGGTLALTGGGTSSGTFALTGNGILDAYDVTFDSTGTAVTGSSGTFGVNDSSIDSNISVGTLTEYGTSTTYFYGTVTATTITTGASTGASPQENFDFLGPTVTTSTFDVYGASVSGTASISAVTFNWTGGSIGNDNGANDVGNLTTSGTATVDLSTAEGTSSLDYFRVTFDGPTSIEAPVTDPGFQLSASSIIFADTTSSPTIAAGVGISTYYAPTRIEIAPGVTLDSPSSGTATIDPEIVNHGTVLLAAGATLDAVDGGYVQFGGTTSLSATSTLDVGTSEGLTLLGGTLGGAGTVTGNVNAVAGKIEGGTGTASGTLTISGSLTLGAGATLTSTLDGTSAGSSYSQVVAASATLAGTLQLLLTAGYVPATGNAYTVLSTTSTPVGSFGQITPALLGTKAYSVAYATTGAVVTVGSSPSVESRLRSSSLTSTAGERVTFTMSIAGASRAAADDGGFVTFYDGTRRIGSGPVAVRNGAATIATTALSLGKHLITARYYVEQHGKVIAAVQSASHVVHDAGKPAKQDAGKPANRSTGERPQDTRSPANRTRRAPGHSK